MGKRELFKQMMLIYLDIHMPPDCLLQKYPLESVWLMQKLREEEGPLTPHSYWYSQDGDGVFRSTGSNQLCVRHH